MENYFEKTQSLSFLGRLLISKDKPFIMLYQEHTSSQRKLILFLAGWGGCGGDAPHSMWDLSSLTRD